MINTSLDEIANRWLLENNLPKHYYMEALTHAATCLRELAFDTLKIVNPLNTPVDNTGNVYLPDDFVDDIAVCFPQGQKLSQLVKQSWITPLRLHDAVTGNYVSYQDQNTVVSTSYFGFPYNGWTWFWNVNAFGEPTGRMFGAQGGTNSGYQLFREQRRIQLSEDFINTNVVLLYISDGQNVTNASQIDPYAFSTIDAFISWKRSPNRNNPYSPEAKNFDRQKRLLRARKDDLTVSDIKNIIRNNYTATFKT